jgi:hypothetical protein
MVVSRNVDLPPRCVRCDAPVSEKPMRVRLSWHSPLAYLGLVGGLLPYVIVALLMTKRLEVHVGLCRQHAQRRRVLIAIAALAFFLGIGLLFVAFTAKQPNGALILLGMLTILFSLITAVVGPRVVWPKRIEDNLAWVKGVCPEYLDKLPDFAG